MGHLRWRGFLSEESNWEEGGEKRGDQPLGTAVAGETERGKGECAQVALSVATAEAIHPQVRSVRRPDR